MTHTVELYLSSVSHQYIGSQDIYLNWFPRVIYWTNGRLFKARAKKWMGTSCMCWGTSLWIRHWMDALESSLSYFIYHRGCCEGTFSGFFLEDVDTRWGDCDRLLILTTITTWRWCLWGAHNIVFFLVISNVFQLLLADYRYMVVYFSPNCGNSCDGINILNLPLDVPVANKT